MYNVRSCFNNLENNFACQETYNIHIHFNDVFRINSASQETYNIHNHFNNIFQINSAWQETYNICIHINYIFGISSVCPETYNIRICFNNIFLINSACHWLSGNPQHSLIYTNFRINSACQETYNIHICFNNIITVNFHEAFGKVWNFKFNIVATGWIYTACNTGTFLKYSIFLQFSTCLWVCQCISNRCKT